MNVALRIATLIFAVIALGTGAKFVLGGLPPGSDAVLDNSFRFLGGIWFAVGLGLIHCFVSFDKTERVFAFLMRALIVGGLARAVGLFFVAPQRAIIVAIVIELVIPPVLLVVRARLSRRARAATPRNGRSVLVTGANGGLGRDTVRELVGDGFSRVVMACRTASKAVSARQDLAAELDAEVGQVLETAGGFDMTDPEKIILAVDALPEGQPFDVVFLQAGGVVFGDAYKTVEFGGHTIERTVFQNVFGAHFVLSRLAERGLLAPGARVVYAGGEGARGIPGLIDKPNFADTAALRNYILGDFAQAKSYNPMNAIGVSKLVGALWTSKLAQLLPERTSILWFSPGLTYGTQGLSGAPALRRFFLEKIGFKLMAALGLAQSPQDGARKYADCLIGKVGNNGDVIGAPEGKALGVLTDQTPMNPAFSNDDFRDEVWRILVELAGPFGERDATTTRSLATFA